MACRSLSAVRFYRKRRRRLFTCKFRHSIYLRGQKGFDPSQSTPCITTASVQFGCAGKAISRPVYIPSIKRADYSCLYAIAFHHPFQLFTFSRCAHLPRALILYSTLRPILSAIGNLLLPARPAVIPDLRALMTITRHHCPVK